MKNIIAYHGTTKKFKTFDASKIKELGFHFGSKEQAETVIFLKKGTIKKYRLTLKNPFDICSDLGNWADLSMLKEYFGPANEGPLSEEYEKGLIKSAHDVVKYLKLKGYDGIKYQNSFEGDTNRKMGTKEQDAFIVFDVKNIKEI